MRLEYRLHAALAPRETPAAARPPGVSEYGPGARYLAWIAGLIQFSVGLAMVITPVQFQGAAYDSLQSQLSVFGLLLCGSALCLLSWQVLPLERGGFPKFSLLLGAISSLLLALGFFRTQMWVGVITFGVFAVGLVAAAEGLDGWLRRRNADLFLALVALNGLLIGAVGAFLGARTAAPAFAGLPVHPQRWLAAGLTMAAVLVLWQFVKGRVWRVLLSLSAGSVLLAAAFQLGVRDNLMASLFSGTILGVGVILRPLLPEHWLVAPRPRIANRMVVVSVVSVSAALVLLMLLVLHQTGATYQAQAAKSLTETAQVVAHDSSEFVRSRQQQAATLSRVPAITGSDPAMQLSFIRRAMQGDAAISQVSIVDRSGQTVVRSSGERPFVDSLPTSHGLSEIMDTHEANWSVESSSRLGKPVLEVRTPILDADGAFNGVYVSQIPLSSLTRTLSDLPIDDGVKIVIVDGSGQVVSHPDPALVATRSDLSALPPIHAALSGQPQPMAFRDGDQRWFGVAVVEPDLGWVVLVQQPESVVLAPLEESRERALAALAIMLVAVSGVAVLVARGFSRPIVELADAAREFGTTSVFPPLPPAGSDETGDLIRAFQEMGERLAAGGRERERVAEVLRDSEERYRGIVETAQEGIWMLDANADTTFANARLAEMLGYEPEELQRSSLFSFVDAAEQAAVSAGLERWRMGIAGRQEVKLRRRDGRELWVLLSANPLRDHAGEFDGVVAMVTDMTNRRRSDEERARLLAAEQAAREEVEALLAATASLGVQADPDEVLRTLVRQAAEILNADGAAYAIRKQDALVVEDRWAHGVWSHDGSAVPIADSILGHVWQSGAPYRSNNLGSDPFVNRNRQRELRHSSMLAVPLCAPDGARLGCIGTYDSRDPGGFSERDERLLVAICETGAAVLVRARDGRARLEAERSAARRKQEVEALLAAADRLNSAVEPEEVLLGVVGVAAQVFAASRVSIATNEGSYALRRHTWLNGAWHSATLRVPLEGSLTGWVITHRKAYRSNDFRNAPEAYGPASFGDTPRQTLAVPILAGDGRALGALNLFDRLDGNAFSDDDQGVAEGIAHHAAVALERATLMDELRRSQKQLKHQAFSDSLTGLPNRPLFLDRLAHALAVVQRSGGGVAVLFIDLDGFKLVNDSLGHAAGDELLTSVADRLARAQRVSDTVARFGGDEFAVLLEGCASPADATRAAERVLIELSRPFDFSDREIVITGSVGISLRSGTGGPQRPEDLLREADIALYQAKAAGKAQAVVFDPSMSAQALERLDLETHLRRAVDNNELVLHYQPIVDLQVGDVIGAEALVRWRHPERGLLAPDTFIRLAEETGIIIPIGRWVLEEACRQARAWDRFGRTGKPFRMCVNLSPRQFEQADLVSQVESALAATGVEAAGLELEITESAVIQNTTATIGTLEKLKQSGVRLAIDDFGTGYSSLSYLQRLSVDTLKIDRSFINGLRGEQSSEAIVQAVVAMAHTLHIEVTAEGIETADQLGLVRVLHCDYGQGFFLSQPVPAGEFEELFTETPAPSDRLSLPAIG